GAVAVVAAVACAACASTRPSMPSQSALEAAHVDMTEKAGTIISEESDVRFERDDKTGEPVARLIYHRLGEIAGARRRGRRTAEASYDKTFTTVDDIVVQARTPDGEDKSWDRNDAVDAPVMPGFVLYSDERGLFLNPPMQPTGSFVDVYTAKTTTSPHLFI